MNHQNTANRTPPTQQLPPTALANSLTTGRSSQVRAGNELASANPPVPVFATVGGFDYVYDLIPDASAGRLVELQSEAVFSGQTTLVIGYRSTDPDEQRNFPDGGELASLSTSLRDFRILAQFGTGNTRHDVECDVSEGSILTLPASHVDVTVYSTFFNRRANQRQRPLKSQAHLASFAGTCAGTVSDPVLAPFQAPLTLTDPPTMQAWLDLLWDAICNESYTAVI